MGCQGKMLALTIRADCRSLLISCRTSWANGSTPRLIHPEPDSKRLHGFPVKVVVGHPELICRPKRPKHALGPGCGVDWHMDGQ